MDGSQYPPYFWDGNDEQQQYVLLSFWSPVISPAGRAPLPVDSASVSDDPPLFNFPGMLVLRTARVGTYAVPLSADYGDPAGFFAQPAQPLDLPLGASKPVEYSYSNDNNCLDLFPFRPELSSSGLRQQPTGPTQYDDHAVQPRWEDLVPGEIVGFT